MTTEPACPHCGAKPAELAPLIYFSCDTYMGNLSERGKSCYEREIESLKRWKTEASQVLDGLNLQDIAEECDFRPGTGIGEQILPWIRKAKKKISELLSESSTAWQQHRRNISELNAKDARIRELEQDLLLANDAAEKGDAARSNAAGMELRIRELEAALGSLLEEYDAAKLQFGSEYLWEKHENTEDIERVRKILKP